jgi:hypothetical protein
MNCARLGGRFLFVGAMNCAPYESPGRMEMLCYFHRICNIAKKPLNPMLNANKYQKTYLHAAYILADQLRMTVHGRHSALPSIALECL